MKKKTEEMNYSSFFLSFLKGEEEEKKRREKKKYVKDNVIQIYHKKARHLACCSIVYKQT